MFTSVGVHAVDTYRTLCSIQFNGGSRMGHLGQMPPSPLPCGASHTSYYKTKLYVRAKSVYKTRSL